MLTRLMFLALLSLLGFKLELLALYKSGCPITLSLTRDLAEEIRLSYFCLSSTLTSYPPISKQ
jgi:hypothetical protein